MNQVWLRIDCVIDLNDEELNGLLKFKSLNERLAEKILTKGLFASGLLYRSKEEYISPNERGTAVSFEELTNTTKRLLSENKRDIPPLKKSIEIKLTDDLKDFVLDNIPVKEVFSESVLYKLTQMIIQDFIEDLESRSSDEVMMIMEGKAGADNYTEYSSLEKNLFIKSHSELWGLETVGFSIKEWVSHFADYLPFIEDADNEYNEFMDNLYGIKQIIISN